MQSKAPTVARYLAELPAERRAALEAVRKVIRANLDRRYEEGMSSGMIAYYVPHSVFPAGYHCDPRQPLPFAGLASQKQYMSLYLMSLYVSDDPKTEPPLAAWFRQAWAKTGKKLDMGKCCVRFKRVEDLALDVVGELVRREPVERYVATYQAALASMGGLRKSSKAATTKPKAAAARAKR
jgi:hypothetical protein